VRYLAYRRTLGPPPRRDRHTVRVRGLDFAVWTTPPVPGAPPLVCVNGGLLFDHRSLWPALQPLAAARQLVFYDQRGRGATPPPPGVRAARIAHDAGDLAALAGALRALLGHPRCDVLGHSWGGGITMLAAALDAASPEPAVGRLVLVNPVGVTGGWLAGLHARRLARLDAWGHATEHAALHALSAEALAEPDPARHAAYARAFFPAWFAEPGLGELFAAPGDASVTGATIAARLRRESYDWRAELRGVRAPSLVVHGEADLLDSSGARATVDLLAAGAPSELHLLEGSGHMPFWERPAAFATTVKAFLDLPTLPT
jgi:proline iminopeptidase